MDDDRVPVTRYARRYDDAVVTPREHQDLKDRVSTVEHKLDRITWLIVATLATALADLWKAIGH